MSETSPDTDNLVSATGTGETNESKANATATATATALQLPGEPKEEEAEVAQQQPDIEAAAVTESQAKAKGVQECLAGANGLEEEHVAALDTLRIRSQKLATRLQQAQQDMANKVNSATEAALIEEKARQFMRIYVPQQQRLLPANATAAGQRQQQQQQQQLPPLPLMMQTYHFTGQPQGYALAMQMQPQLQQLQLPAPPQGAANATRKPKKSRRALNHEVDALQGLVQALTTLNPEVNTIAHQLIQQNEVLAQMEWLFIGEPGQARFHGQQQPQQQQQQLRRIDGGSEQQPSRQQQQQQQQRARRESELSSTSNSSAPPPPSQQQQQQQQQHQMESLSGLAGAAAAVTPRKRNRKRRDTAKKNTPRSLKTELDAMRMYINKIVQHYVGTEQPLPAELHFRGDFGELEAHAQRLVAAGYGRIVEDEIRINRKNNRQAFITMSTDRETLERDGIVLLPVARRYAFEGDTVRAFVLNVGAAVTKSNDEAGGGGITGGHPSFSLAEEEELSDETESQDSDADNVAVILSDNCPKAFVISIIKQTELRQIVGTISFTNPTKLCNDDEQLFYKFRPYDLRVPMVYVDHASCAEHIANCNKQQEVCGLLFLAHILETDSNGHCIAQLVQPVGRVGNLDDELKAILFHNGLRDVVPFEQRFIDMYAEPAAPPSAVDLERRQDMRKQCVFTIDPLTARDLDDAMSIEKLGDNEFEVGVHISDVSHYLLENSELDNIVKERSTSIYLINEVIHMLPQTLCFRCSLLPGEDKFAFSVFWRMSGDGQFLDAKPRFTRSVINSCTQFAYEHAQKIIDNPHEHFTEDDFPSILNGFGAEDIVKRVLWLQGIASSMRSGRFDNGALTINNAKLRFSLDPISGEPQCYEVEQQREANRMIEEFMLLANQAVAKHIHDIFPDIAVLRNHPPPLMKSMKALHDKLQALGFELDYSSSKAVQESMVRLCSDAADPIAMSACLSQLLMKPMARAKYFCSDGRTEPSELWHYALSIPIYTHFTSPIRRYPDILVHRLLAAALNYCPAPARTPDELHALTKIANERKYNAKLAGDDSGNLYFKRYVRSQQGLYMRAVVMEIFQHMMNVVTLESGHVISINYKMQKVLVDTRNAPNYVFITERNLKTPPTKLQLLSLVPIRLIVWDNKLTGFLLTSEQRQRGKEESKRINGEQARPSAAPAGSNGTRKPKYNQRSKQQQPTNNSNNNSTANSNNTSHNRATPQRNRNHNNNSNNNQRQAAQGQEQQQQQPQQPQQQQQQQRARQQKQPRFYAVRQNSL